ncbi:MAG: hypothetical protein ACOYON_01575 [Fimbriimonas sp.]
MKSVAVALFAAMALSVFAQDTTKVTIAATPKVGDVVSHKVLFKFDVSGAEVKIEGTRKLKVEKIEETQIVRSFDLSTFTVKVNDSDQSINITAGEVTLKKDGELLKINGGIEGSDEARIFLATFFAAPAAPVAAGDKFSVEYKEGAQGTIPKRKFESVYVGKEDLKGKSVHKFTQKYTEPGVTGGMTVESTFWVTEDGTIQKIDAKFKSMFIPAVGQYVDGTVTAEIVA